MAAFDGGSMASDTGLLLRRLDQRLSVFDLARATDPLSQVTCPVVHQDPRALKQVRAGIGRLHPIPDRMRQGRLDHLPGMVRPHPPSPGRSSGTRAARPRNDRRFLPPGVKQMPPYECHPFRGGGVTSKGDMLLTTTTLFSQRAEPSPLSFGTLPKRRMGRGTTRISRVRFENAKRGSASRVPPSPGASARRTGGLIVEGATPLFWTLVRHRGGVKGDTQNDTFTLPSERGRSLHSDPFGKAAMKTWSQVIPVNLALTAVGLRVWLAPWPSLGEVPLPDLIHATDPLGLSTLRPPGPPPVSGPGNAASRPSEHAAARTGPSRHRPPPPGSGPHAPGHYESVCWLAISVELREAKIPCKQEQSVDVLY